MVSRVPALRNTNSEKSHSHTRRHTQTVLSYQLPHKKNASLPQGEENKEMECFPPFFPPLSLRLQLRYSASLHCSTNTPGDQRVCGVRSWGTRWTCAEDGMRRTQTSIKPPPRPNSSPSERSGRLVGVRSHLCFFCLHEVLIKGTFLRKNL